MRIWKIEIKSIKSGKNPELEAMNIFLITTNSENLEAILSILDSET